MHYTKLDKSSRLQKILQYLHKRGDRGATTAEIATKFKLQSASTWLSMLRHNGVDVLCEYVKTTDDGAKIFRYKVSA